MPMIRRQAEALACRANQTVRSGDEVNQFQPACSARVWRENGPTPQGVRPPIYSAAFFTRIHRSRPASLITDAAKSWVRSPMA